MKKAFLIRGFRFGFSAADSDWRPIKEIAKQCGYEPVPITWTWDYKTMSQYTSLFIDYYNANKADENIIIGHSFGAVVAFLAGPIVKPDLLVLCSLSAYFREDLPKYTNKDWIFKHMGKRRRADFKTISAKSTAEKIRKAALKVDMIVGAKEKDIYPMLYKRVTKTAEDLKLSNIKIIKGTDHTIFDDRYLNAIKNAISMSK